VAEAARAAGVKRFWYASSACIYPEGKQTSEDLDGASGLKESDAWPAQPQDAYGLEKLVTEELLMRAHRPSRTPPFPSEQPAQPPRVLWRRPRSATAQTTTPTLT